MVIGNKHEILVKNGRVVPKIRSWADRHAHHSTPLRYSIYCILYNKINTKIGLQ